MFGCQHKKEVVGVLDFFLSLLSKYEGKIIHNMLFLMLDPRFRNLHLLSSLFNHEQMKAIIEEYDTKYLYLMFMKWHHHLHPLVEFEINIVD
jgi:hypothetical protein